MTFCFNQLKQPTISYYWSNVSMIHLTRDIPLVSPNQPGHWANTLRPLCPATAVNIVKRSWLHTALWCASAVKLSVEQLVDCTTLHSTALALVWTAWPYTAKLKKCTLFIYWTWCTGNLPSTLYRLNCYNSQEYLTFERGLK